MATDTKFKSNGIMEKKWLDGNILQFTFLDHSVLRFDRRLAAAGNRDEAERLGWGSKHGDRGAISVEEFPDRKARSQEAKRRIKLSIDHFQGPSSSWEVPAERAASGPTKDDLLAILERAMPGKGELLLKGQLKLHGDDVKAAGAAMLATEKLRTIWIDIQAERTRSASKNLPSSDDLLAAMMGAIEDEGEESEDGEEEQQS